MATKMGCILTAIILLAMGAANCDEEIANLHMLRAEERTNISLPVRPRSGHPKDCSAVQGRSGLHVIKPAGSPPLVVYCQLSRFGGGWTMIQKNTRPPKITWKESWTAYKFGFGNILQDYWLGNEYIFKIISQGNYIVMFLLYDCRRIKYVAFYDSFAIANERSGYQLNLGRYFGNASNAMIGNEKSSIHDNMKFSTFDRDQDLSTSNCAQSCKGGFWYNSCYRVNLNSKSIYWSGVCKGDCILSQILIKPSNVCRRVY